MGIDDQDLLEFMWKPYWKNWQTAGKDDLQESWIEGGFTKESCWNISPRIGALPCKDSQGVIHIKDDKSHGKETCLIFTYHFPNLLDNLTMFHTHENDIELVLHWIDFGKFWNGYNLEEGTKWPIRAVKENTITSISNCVISSFTFFFF